MIKNLLLLLFCLFSFSAIHADDNGSCGNNVTWKFTSSDGTLTISGTGNMTNFVDERYVPWGSLRDEIKKVVIADGVTNIGNFAFDICETLTSIEIPNSVTSIGMDAFSYTALTSVTIPNSVTSIGDYAFYYCSGLTSITIPNSVTSIGRGAFQYCSNLSSITIPNSVTSIGDHAFDSCSGLTSVTIPNSVTSLGKFAFYDCSSLTSVTIGRSVESIGAEAFNMCRKLTSMTFKGITHPEFGRGVFRYVNRSISIYVPSKSIEAYKNALSGQFNNEYNVNIQAIPPISLKDNEAYTQDSQVDGVDVSYTRNFTNTNWQALYLPFSLKYEDWKDDFEVARINAVRQYDDNDDGNIDRTVLEFVKMTNDDSVIEPNTPYIIKAKNSGKKTISVENTTLYESAENSIECSTTTEKFIFTGLYEKMSLLQKASGKYYVMDKGNLSKITTLSDIGPYRWYMKRENRKSAYGINNNNTAKEISISVVGEETTDIANIQHTSPNTQTYDLNGRKVNENNLKPGMYVKNGRKFVIK